MAKAPRPGGAGTTGGQEKVKAAAETIRLRIGEESRDLRPGMLTIQERLVVRKATGLPLEQFLNGSSFGLDSLLVIWWLAARQNGEAMLTLNKAEETFPMDVVESGDVDLERITPDEDDDDPSS